MYWIGKKHKVHRKKNEIGGKAYHLFKLQDWGIEVPDFLAVTTAAFHHWKAHGDLPAATWAEIEEEVSTWGTSDFAVRSSMSLEDGADDSFAGIMESYLYVQREEIRRKVFECFASCETDRARQYLTERKIHLDLEAAVVIQKMAHSKKSGVAFSRAPVGNSSVIYVESSWGLGEGVVSGLVDVDQYYLSRFGDVLRAVIGTKEKRVDLVDKRAEERTALLDVPAELRDASTLYDEELALLFKQILLIEDFMQKPSDIEWCFDKNDRLAILQTRDITQKFPPIRYYVDTNLTESYPGVTSPFNADFVKKAYEQVFNQAFEILSMSKEKRVTLETHTRDLIAYFGGHLYYHIFHYYAVFHSLPGGKSARDAWHKMIGGHIPNSMELPGYVRWSFLDKVKYYQAVASLVLFHETTFTTLEKETRANLRRLFADLDAATDPRATFALFFRVVESNLGFAYTILNDYLIMMCLNLIEKYVRKYSLSNEDYTYMIKPQSDFDSIKPLKALRKLLKHPAVDPTFLSRFEAWAREFEDSVATDPYVGIYTQMSGAGYGSLVPQIQDYLQRYGNRAFEELKIESLTFKQSPINFSQLLTWQYPTRDQDIKDHDSRAYRFPWEKITGVDRLLLKKLILFSHRTVSTRENTRLLRTEIYGWVRECMLKAFKTLKRNHPALFGEVPIKNFFSLSFSDLRSYVDGRTSEEGLADLIRRQQKWITREPNFPEFFCHPEGHDVPSFDEFVATDSVESLARGGEITGLGASPGILEATPVVLHSPQEALRIENLAECILVTKSTDPAWIFILTQCRGLISEKGSLLSHTAILGRELNKPTVVGVKNATQLLAGIKKISMDGKTGKIQVIE